MAFMAPGSDEDRLMLSIAGGIRFVAGLACVDQFAGWTALPPKGTDGETAPAGMTAPAGFVPITDGVGTIPTAFHPLGVV